MSISSSSTAAAAPTANADRALISGNESYRWVVLGVAVVAQVTASVVSQGVYIMVPLWQSAYHLSHAYAALAVSVMNAGQILTMVRLGMAIDRRGERSVVAYSMVAMSLAAFGVAVLAVSYPVLLLCLTALGACYAAVQPGGTRAILRWFPPQQRGMATGVRQAGLPLGTALAAVTLPALALKYGWHAAAWAQGVVGVVGGVLFGIFHRDDVGQAKTGALGAPPSFRALFRMLAKHSALWPVMFAGVVMAAFQYTFSTHVIMFLTSDLKLETIAASFLFAVTQGVGIAGRISLAWVSDHFWPGERIRSLGWTMVVCALGVVALMFLPDRSPTWLLLLIFTVLGFFGIGWYPLYILQVAEMAPKTAVASTISFAMTLNMIAISVMPLLFGVIVDLSSYQAAWTLLVALLALFAVYLRRSATRAAG
jgi:MFS family permease